MKDRRGFALLTLVLGLAAAPWLWARDEEPAATDAPRIEMTKTHLNFLRGKQLFTRYHFDMKVAKPYFYPVYAAEGLPVTRAWPIENDPEVKKGDHPHQKSIWFCHGDVIPEGFEFKKYFRNVEGVDFWSEGLGHGKILCVQVNRVVNARDHAAAVTMNEWRTAEGKKILDERRTIYFYPLGPTGNLLVLDIDLHASVYPITFADTKEGSLGVRVREVLRGDRKGLLTNAEGKTGEGKRPNKDRKGVWGLRSDWCDYSGTIDEKHKAGISVFADPKNPIDTCWHVGNYGLMAANPFGREKHAGFPDRAGNNTPVKLARDEHLRLRYGIYVHTGDVKDGKVAEAYARFVKLAGK
ncbi:MAG: PmoA family protein [Gemmataceae bacterium]